MPELSAQSVLVFDQASGQPLLAKNATLQTPIASITKLMTAMLVLDAAQPLDEKITITADDRDTLKGTGSRLAIGSSYTRGQLLHLALIASDNRAAHALGRTYPGGLERFVATMNRMARALGMHDTVYVEPTGLSSEQPLDRDWISPNSPITRIRISRKFATSAAPAITPSAPSAWW